MFKNMSKLNKQNSRGQQKNVDVLCFSLPVTLLKMNYALSH